MKNLLLIILGGGCGSGLRYLINNLVQKNWPGNFPAGTLLINITGSLLIGIIIGYYGKNNSENESIKLLLTTGFCGGFTTFSAFAFENFRLFQTNHPGTALFYIGASINLGLCAVWLGTAIGKI